VAENFGGLAGLIFSSNGRRKRAGVLIGKGGPEGFFGATTLAAGFLPFKEERATDFLFAALGALREGAFDFFLALDFLAMKFQS
jgi:hypothetical protein